MLRYRIQIHDVNAYLCAVEVEIPVINANQACVLQLPAWIPGSYMIRDFAKNIIGIQAKLNGQAIAIEHCDKQTWQVQPSNAGLLVVSYQVYAFDLSVRSAYLDQHW